MLFVSDLKANLSTAHLTLQRFHKAKEEAFTAGSNKQNELVDDSTRSWINHRSNHY